LADPLRTVDWREGRLVLIDQTKIPLSLEYVELTSSSQVVSAIKSMAVRGAPAIGAAAAYGVAFAARECAGDAGRFSELVCALREARPTAVNLMWAVDRVVSRIAPAVESGRTEDAFALAVREAGAICEEDIAANTRIGEAGAALIPHGARVLTHCNAGELATVSGGTALAVILHAHRQGRNISVFADETRPRFQGLRLTAWELGRAGVPVTVIPDSAAAWLMGRGRVDVVVVGADRIAANGDIANKIGTYSVAVNARAHGIPFYVAAPVSTVDLSCPDGSHIPIEERDASEVLGPAGLAAPPDGVAVMNPAFDVTPADLIAAIITDRGVLSPDYSLSIPARCADEGQTT